MKKVWIIKGTSHFDHSKQELKKVRDQLNTDAGFVKATALEEHGGNIGKATKGLPFRISKGPDHPAFAE